MAGPLVEISVGGLGQLQRLPAELERARVRLHEAILREAPRAMASKTPKGRRDKIARGWRARSVDQEAVVVENRVPGAAALDVDREIRPRNRRYLRFPRRDGAGFVYTKGPVVQRGADYIRPGEDLVEQVVEREYERFFGSLR